jgi:hypothetical protein
MADLRRDFWIRETGTSQQVAQIHDRYKMMMMMMMITNSVFSVSIACSNFYLSVFLTVIFKNNFRAILKIKYFPPSTHPRTTIQIT